jgi:hypothetical protein
MLKLFHTEDPALPELPPQAIPIVKKLLDPQALNRLRFRALLYSLSRKMNYLH